VRFAAGALVGRDDKYQGDRFIFEHGSFAITPTGHALSSLDADAPDRFTDPVKDVSASHQLLGDYLIARGVPSDQIGGMHVTTIMSGTGTPKNPGNDTFHGYVSNVQRMVGGVPVVDSIGWAKFRTDGTTVSESIFWPALPASLLDDIKKFQAALGQTELGKIIDQMSGNKLGVVIRHTPLFREGPLKAAVCYDIVSEGSRARNIHVGLDGKPVVFDWELFQLPDSVRSPPP
jgi:hypothetical protein